MSPYLFPDLVKHLCGICGGFAKLQDRIPEFISNHKRQMNMGSSIGVMRGVQGGGHCPSTIFYLRLVFFWGGAADLKRGK